MIFVNREDEGIFGDAYVVIGATLPQEDGTMAFYNARDIFTSAKVNAELSMNKNFSFVWTKLNSYPYPTLNGELDLSDDSEVALIFDYESGFNITALNELMQVDDLAEIEDAVSDDLTPEQLKSLITDTIELHESIRNMNFKYPNLSIMNSVVKQAVQGYNSQSNGEFVDYFEKKEKMKRMRSLIQNRPDDRLFLVLPEIVYSSVGDLEEELNIDSAFVWAQEEYFNPLGENTQDINYNNVSTILKDTSYDDIHGHAECDNLVLQDNEKDYYNYLVQYIEDSYKAYGASKGLSDEDLKTQKKNLVIPEKLKNTLDTLIRLMCNKCWKFSPNIPLNELTQATDDGDSDAINVDAEVKTSGSSESDKMEFIAVERSRESVTRYQDYTTKIYNLLATNKCNVLAYAEVIIKLARWGNRRPVNLELNFPLSEGNSRYVMEIENFEYTINTKSYDLNVEKFNDHDYILIGYVMSSDYVIDLPNESETYEALKTSNLTEVPPVVIGFLCAQKVTINENVMVRNCVLDLPTAIEMYENNSLDIEGLNFIENSNGELEIDHDSLIDTTKIVYNDVAIKIVEARDFKNKYFVNPVLANYSLNRKQIAIANYFNMMPRLLKGINTLITAFNGDLQKFVIRSSSLLCKYINDVKEADAHNIEEQLDIFVSLYSEYINTRSIEESESISEGLEQNDISRETALFDNVGDKKKKKITPVYLFQIKKDRNFFFRELTNNDTEAKAHNCKMAIDFFTSLDDVEIDSSKLKKTLKGTSALKFVLRVAVDKRFKNGVYMSVNEFNFLNKILTELDISVDYNTILSTL